jgi:hypothetical protein
MSVILRIPPYPLSVSYTVPESNTSYILSIDDVLEQSELVEYVTSDSNSKITYSLNGDFTKYDKSYSVKIYEDLLENDDILLDRGNIVVEDNLQIERPYVNPNTLGTTSTEIREYTQHEGLARAIIDSVVDGFYYSRKFLEVVGQQTDYIPLWDRTHKIVRAYENSLLVYDVSNPEGPILGQYNYIITTDKSAITKDPVTAISSMNRAERSPLRIPLASSDSYGLFDTEDSGNTQTITPGVGFPSGTDYVFLLEIGYPVVPIDIQDATRLLIDDIKCGKLDYYKRYVKNYSTDQFKIEYDKRMMEGTGNIIVDKILSKYVNSITRPGVL